MYSRSLNDKFTIRSDEEKVKIINCVNNQIFKQSLFKCISLVTAISPNNEILLKGLVCRNDDSKQIQIYNTSGCFPGLRIQNLDGTIVGTATFEENQFVVDDNVKTFEDKEVTKINEASELKDDQLVEEETSIDGNNAIVTTVNNSGIDIKEIPTKLSVETEETQLERDEKYDDGIHSETQPAEVISEKQSTPRKRGRRKKTI